MTMQDYVGEVSGCRRGVVLEKPVLEPQHQKLRRGGEAATRSQVQFPDGDGQLLQSKGGGDQGYLRPVMMK